MNEIETIKAEIKKLSAKAVKLKMDLHDLSEELPQNWERIPELAKDVYEVYALLSSKRTELARLEGR